MKVTENVFSKVLRRFHDVTSEEWKEKKGCKTAKIFTTEQKNCVIVHEFDLLGFCIKATTRNSWKEAENYLRQKGFEPFENED